MDKVSIMLFTKSLLEQLTLNYLPFLIITHSIYESSANKKTI